MNDELCITREDAAEIVAMFREVADQIDMAPHRALSRGELSAEQDRDNFSWMVAGDVFAHPHGTPYPEHAEDWERGRMRLTLYDRLVRAAGRKASGEG